MKFSSIRLVCAGAFVTIVGLLAATNAFAIDDPWVAGTANWNVGSNWANTIVPNAAQDDRPVVNNGGTAQITSAVPDVAGLIIGQIAGETGTVELSTATGDLNVLNSGVATGGGVVTVGALGTGILRISGGTGTTPALRPVLTAVDVSSGGNVANAIELSDFARITTQTSFLRGTTRVTGPNVDFTATITLIMEPTHVLVANITSPTAHSPIKSTGPLVAAGTLNASFTAQPAFGQEFSVLDANILVGNFTNFANVPVTGVTAPVLGEVYRVKRVSGAAPATIQGNALKLIRDKVLTLEVNRDSGAVSIRNPLGGSIQIDGYTITSAAGSLEPGTGNGAASTWNSLTNQLGSGWGQDGTPTGNGLGETKNVGSTDFTAVSSQPIGNAYDDSNAFFANGIGATGQDLIFDYSTLSGEVIRGQVAYTGIGKANSLLLTIDSTGFARLKNDSPGNITIDSYSILSTGAALLTGGFNDVATPNLTATFSTASAISELATDPISPLVIATNTTYNLGTIFNTAMPEEGISLEFTTSSQNILYNGVVRFEEAAAGVLGDYNDNGVVDAADYTLWRNNLGGVPTALLRRDPSNAANIINAADYTFWKSRFGATTGSGIGSLAAGNVPEPSTALMLLGMAVLVPVAQRKARLSIA